MPTDGRRAKNENPTKKGAKPLKSNFKQKTLLDHFVPKYVSREPQDNTTNDRDADLVSNNSKLYTISTRDEEYTDIIEHSNDDSAKPMELSYQESNAHPPCIAAEPPEVKQEPTKGIQRDSTPEGTRYEPIIIDNSSPFKPESTNEIQQQDTSKGAPRQPIVIDLSSPIKTIPPKPPQPVHPFFRRTNKTTQLGKSTRQTTSLPTPYPTSETQHVKGTQTNFAVTSSHSYFRRESRKPELSCYTNGISQLAEDNGITSSIPLPPKIVRFPDDNTSKEAYINQIPESHIQQHPAIASVLNRNDPSESGYRSSWFDRWYPRRAVEVLANESNAVYLRNWLQALELKLETTLPTPSETPAVPQRQAGTSKRGTKRPRILRAVEKRGGRKRQRVDSDDESGLAYMRYDPFDDDAHEEPYIDSEKLSKGDCLGFSAFQGENLDQLYNTIVLTGPSGSGKTSSVYACAEELGWKVFEVYPGIGKRNGANLDVLIGDVGKNHVLPNGAALQDRRTPTSSYDGEQQTAYDTILSGDLETVLNEQEFKPGIQQSVILLEEVDILFKEDANFWPAVIKFISQSRRPVICTCNDLSLVPLSELPLQAILTMEPCPPSIAASYLQSISYAEGCMVEREALLELYNRNCTVGLDGTLEYNVLLPDLRKSIHALQLWCTTDNLTSSSAVQEQEHRPQLPVGNPAPNPHSETPQETLSFLRSMFNQAEYMSFADSELTRNPAEAPMALHNYECKPCVDDEIGHLILFDMAKGNRSSFGMYDRDEEIVSTGVLVSRGLVKAGTMQEPRLMEISGSSFDTDSLLRARLDIRNKMDDVLRQVCPATMVSSRNPWLYTDYIPWIRHLLVADDEQERQHAQNWKGRTTKNSGGYVRTIELTNDARRGLVESELG